MVGAVNIIAALAGAMHHVIAPVVTSLANYYLLVAILVLVSVEKSALLYAEFVTRKISQNLFFLATKKMTMPGIIPTIFYFWKKKKVLICHLLGSYTWKTVDILLKLVEWIAGWRRKITMKRKVWRSR